MTLPPHEVTRLLGVRDKEECAVCGGMLRFDNERIYCWKDPTHEGTRKPRRTPKPYGVAGNRADELLSRRHK